VPIRGVVPACPAHACTAHTHLPILASALISLFVHVMALAEATSHSYTSLVSEIFVSNVRHDLDNSLTFLLDVTESHIIPLFSHFCEQVGQLLLY